MSNNLEKIGCNNSVPALLALELLEQYDLARVVAVGSYFSFPDTEMLSFSASTQQEVCKKF